MASIVNWCPRVGTRSQLPDCGFPGWPCMGHPSYPGLGLLHSRAGAGGDGCSEGQAEQGGKRSGPAG
eukprot:7298925-Prorocentrum_lima.AAC.1